jgi:Flp pilus assembly protein TadG
MLPLLLLVAAVTIDIGRMFAVQSEYQAALDAAALGAVATQSAIPVEVEVANLFNANYPANYLGSIPGPITVTQDKPGVYKFTGSSD